MATIRTGNDESIARGALRRKESKTDSLRRPTGSGSAIRRATATVNKVMLITRASGKEFFPRYMRSGVPRRLIGEWFTNGDGEQEVSHAAHAAA